MGDPIKVRQVSTSNEDGQPASLVQAEEKPAPTSPELKPNWEETLAKAASLQELELALANCPSPLRQTATSTVFAAGNPSAQAVLVGEAPGADEDKAGLPFVGRCGQLLDQALHLVNLSRDKQNIYITNLVPWRPPGNRTPSEQEISYFTPYLKKHLSLTNSNYLLLLGAVATNALLGLKISLSKLRGKSFQVAINGRSITAVVTYHPAYLLRQPSAKQLFWSDLIYFRNLLKTNKQAAQSLAD